MLPLILLIPYLIRWLVPQSNPFVSGFATGFTCTTTFLRASLVIRTACPVFAACFCVILRRCSTTSAGFTGFVVFTHLTVFAAIFPCTIAQVLAGFCVCTAAGSFGCFTAIFSVILTATGEIIICFLAGGFVPGVVTRIGDSLLNVIKICFSRIIPNGEFFLFYTPVGLFRSGG